MKTIVYLGAELPDKDAASHRVINNAKIMRDLGYNVVLLGTDKALLFDDQAIDNKSIVQGFQAFAMPYPKTRKQWLSYLADKKQIVELCNKLENVEAIVLYNHPSASMFRVLRYCKKRNIKVIGDVTEWYSATGRGLAFLLLKSLDTSIRMRYLHKKLDGLIVISRYLEKYYRNCCNVYIPALTDMKDTKWQKQDTNIEDDLHIVYAGSPGRKDRINYLIEAATFVRRELRIDIIGITEQQYLELYPEHETIIKTIKGLHFHGRLSHLETVSYVKQADYSCFFRESNRMTNAGFPTKFAEALTCGTPVITNRTSNIDEYMCIENGVLLDELSVQNIANCLEEVKRGVVAKRDTFDYRHYLENMWQFLQKLGV